MQKLPSVNVLGGVLEPCSMRPITGFFRDGACNTCFEDAGSHTVCAVMTAEFLAFSAYVGNDLSTPHARAWFCGPQTGRCLVPLRRAVSAGLG